MSEVSRLSDYKFKKKLGPEDCILCGLNRSICLETECPRDFHNNEDLQKYLNETFGQGEWS